MSLLSMWPRIRLVLLYVVLALPFIIYGAFQALQTNNNSPIDWVDATFPARRQYDELVEQFGPDDAVIVSWPGCTWDNPCLDTLSQTLHQARGFRLPDGSPCFSRILTGRETLRQLTSEQQWPAAGLQPAQPSLADSSSAAAEPLSSFDASPGELIPEPELNEREDIATSSRPALNPARSQIPLTLAVRRLQGTLIGADGKTTCLVIYFTPAAMPQRAALLRQIRQSIVQTCQVTESDLHFAGSVVDGLAVDQASQETLQKYAAPSAMVVLIICWLSLRSFRAGLMVFTVAAFCQGATLAIIHYSGESLSALLIILPPLIQVLAVAGGIHLTNYYFDAPEALNAVDAARDAFHQGWKPCALSAVTTAMGTASLMMSGVTPIRMFGIYATVGVLLTAVTVLTIIPVTLMLTAIRRPRHSLHAPVPRNSLGAAGVNTNTDSGHSQQIDRGGAPVRRDTHAADAGELVSVNAGWFWNGLHARLQSLSSQISLLFVAGMLIVAMGLPHVQTSVRIETLFAEDSRVLRDYRWLESHVGLLVPIEILVRFPGDHPVNARHRLGLLQQIEDNLKLLPSVRATSSALTFFPPLPAMPALPERVRIAAANHAVAAARPQFEALDVLRGDDESGETWRMTAHCSAVDPVDYGELTTEIRQSVTQAITQHAAFDQSAPRFAISGVMPLVQQIQRQLLSDLFQSLISAMVVITVTMTIAEAGLLKGLLAMLSNIFPVLVLFGLMGLLQVPMDIGSIMTASVALGIAVDDTLHFLTFFRRALNRGYSRSDAVLYSYRHCGKAMVQTSVSCGLGLLVFTMSDFVPTSRFALLMGSLLLLALLGDLVLLPALLMSPVGRIFRSARPRRLPFLTRLKTD